MRECFIRILQTLQFASAVVSPMLHTAKATGLEALNPSLQMVRSPIWGHPNTVDSLGYSQAAATATQPDMKHFRRSNQRSFPTYIRQGASAVTPLNPKLVLNPKPQTVCPHCSELLQRRSSNLQQAIIWVVL